MISSEIKNIVEALIFASEDEITTRQIKEIADSSGVRISVNDIEASINSLNEDYRTFNKSFEIIKIAGGYSFSTKKEYGRFVGKLFEEKQKKKLSQSALETLSIIAYKQPITRNEIEFVRGVNVDYIVNSLLERDLIKIHGRSDSPGRPILYATTNTFLKVLGLNSLEDLPKLKEINDILKNEEIEGITEADIELFNSVNNFESSDNKITGQLELISSKDTDTNNEKDPQVSESSETRDSDSDITGSEENEISISESNEMNENKTEEKDKILISSEEKSDEPEVNTGSDFPVTDYDTENNELIKKGNDYLTREGEEDSM
ncbi:MAG TPA: SMC-Scp complex subunit ScpB [Ignavibacteria bacterium]|nr:SMC-Scp complex subunit ScpB [Ignavibacteria bacterium]HRJ99790.1 SMC-Scp complex subunit ScpB [Ignavibacteria bacterium]